MPGPSELSLSPVVRFPAISISVHETLHRWVAAFRFAIHFMGPVSAWSVDEQYDCRVRSRCFTTVSVVVSSACVAYSTSISLFCRSNGHSVSYECLNNLSMCCVALLRLGTGISGRGLGIEANRNRSRAISGRRTGTQIITNPPSRGYGVSLSHYCQRHSQCYWHSLRVRGCADCSPARAGRVFGRAQ